MRNMDIKYHKGFTLIELLVVIAIIALLLSIIMPALQATKKQAQAVVCKSNVKQWATCYILYTQENDDSFPPFIIGTVSTTYMENLRAYYDDVDKMRICPAAAKVVSDNPTGGQPLSYFGSTFTAWQIDPSATWLSDEDWGVGSYGENSWLRKRNFAESNKCWVKMSALRPPSNVPLFADSKWNNSWVRGTDSIPTVSPADNRNTTYSISNWREIDNHVMRRHKNGLNVAFGDLSAVDVEVEGLWRLRWNQDYETRRDVDLSDLQ